MICPRSFPRYVDLSLHQSQCYHKFGEQSSRYNKGLLAESPGLSSSPAHGATQETFRAPLVDSVHSLRRGVLTSGASQWTIRSIAAYHRFGEIPRRPRREAPIMAEERITIRRLQETEHFHECEDVQRRAWGMGDISILPAHMLIPAQQSGGLVLVAFNEKEEMVGFLFGFLGTREPMLNGQTAAQRLKHCSHMMGVVPEYQTRGVGYLLKLEQAAHVRSQGLDLVTWTYDPLESVNANLNLCKLGVICNTYAPDYYGRLSDVRNAGLPSDRFHVDWWVSSRRVEERLDKGAQKLSLIRALDGGALQINRVSTDREGLPRPSSCDLGATKEELLVEIPASFQSIRETDLSLALEWRLHTRDMFTHYFDAGYTVTEFISEIRDQVRHSYYLLSRDYVIL